MIQLERSQQFMQRNAGVDVMFHRSLTISIMIPSQNDPEEDDTEEEEGEDAGYDSDDMDEIANDLPFDPVSLHKFVNVSSVGLWIIIRTIQHFIFSCTI